MTTLLVDGNNILMRSLRAAQGGRLDLSNEEGTPTAALLIFINMLSRYVRQVEPDSIVVAWDGGRCRFRTEIFPDYKAGRPDAPEDDKESAFALAKEFLLLAGISQVTFDGLEADDVIAGYCATLDGQPVVILSGDKDLIQLVSRTCTQIRPDPRAEDEAWTLDRVEAEFGCSGARYALIKALAGDPSDGIPGIPRVGLKTARKDLDKAGWDLDALLDSGPPRYRENREVIFRNIALMDLTSVMQASQSLVEEPLWGDRPLPTIFTVEGDHQWPLLLAFLDRYGFAQIRSRLESCSLWRERQSNLFA